MFRSRSTKTSAKTITRVMIRHVDKNINAKYIRKVFERLNIAKVSNVDIKPNKYNSEYNRVVLHLDEWYDNETAYNLIKRIRSSTHEARVMYDEPNWWVLEEVKVDEKKKEKKMWLRAQKALKKLHHDFMIEQYIQQKMDDYKEMQQIEDMDDWENLSRSINIEVGMW